MDQDWLIAAACISIGDYAFAKDARTLLAASPLQERIADQRATSVGGFVPLLHPNAEADLSPSVLNH